jgi:L-alanine-DL-glutamate epimerase-like enolase superfamily enzyme
VKITQVEAIPFAIPYVNPLRFASGEVHTAEHVLVRVHTDDGVTGVAEAPPRRSPTARPKPASSR